MLNQGKRERKRARERGRKRDRNEGRERGQRVRDEVMICKALENVAHYNAKTVYHVSQIDTTLEL